MYLEECNLNTTLLNCFSSVKRAIKIYTRYHYTTVQNWESISFITKDIILQGLLLT